MILLSSAWVDTFAASAILTAEMTGTLRRILLWFGVVAGVLLIAGMVFLFVSSRSSPSSPIPSPNGYDGLLKAGQIVTIRTSALSDLDRGGLRALVATNAEALRVLRLGLSRRCAVPTDAAITNFGAVNHDLIGLKSLAWVLSAEGRLAEMENRPADAARSYVDSIRLGTELSRGGFMINRLVGIACEAIGGSRHVKLLPRLTCEQMRSLVTELEQIDSNTVSWAEVMNCERRFARAQIGNFPNPVRLASDWWQARKVAEASRRKHDSTAAHLRLLSTEMALRCYRCDRGNAPASLAQLVPQYLGQVPLDPFSGRPLIYRADGTNWLLYSVGIDAVDDGGKSIDRSKSDDVLIGLGTAKSIRGQANQGDLQYDSPW